MNDIIGTIAGRWSTRECPQCGLLWVDPQPVPEEIHNAYEKYPTHENHNTNATGLKERIKLGYWAWRYGYREKDVALYYKILGFCLLLVPHKRVSADFWFKRLVKKPQGHLLDIGCGGGELIEFMNNWGWYAEGIDPDIKAVQNAQSKGLLVRQGSFMESNYRPNSFDAIVSSHVFEHLYEPVEFLKKCWGLLKPQGQLLIATPNASALQRKIFGKHWMALDPPRHLHIFNPQSMALCAKLAGIEHFRIITTSRGSRFIAAASMHILKNKRYLWTDKPDIQSRIAAELIETLEPFIVLADKNKGVEMLFSATKPQEVYQA